MSEHALQVAVAHMLQLVLDPDRTWWTAIDHAAKLSARYGGERKKRGVKRGLPDIMLMIKGTNAPLADVIGIELKTDKGRLSPAQIEVGTAWMKMGHAVYVARSLEEVQEILDHLHVPMRSRMKFFGGTHGQPAQRSVASRHPRARHQRKPKGDVPLVQR